MIPKFDIKPQSGLPVATVHLLAPGHSLLSACRLWTDSATSHAGRVNCPACRETPEYASALEDGESDGG